MRNRSPNLATVLTALLILPLTRPSNAQQTAPPPTETQTPVTQPEQVGPVKIGGPVKPPRVTYSVEPQYTEEARRKKFSGNVQIYCWVEENGKPSHIKVVRGVGMGLDEKAVEAVRQFKFKPATRDGKPVTVDLYIDVNFDGS